MGIVNMNIFHFLFPKEIPRKTVMCIPAHMLVAGDELASTS